MQAHIGFNPLENGNSFRLIPCLNSRLSQVGQALNNNMYFGERMQMSSAGEKVQKRTVRND